MDTYTILTYLGLGTIGISGVAILSGLTFILLGHRELHKRSMITASLFALVFVGIYLTKSYLYPPTKYTGEHRTLYFTILWTHTVLAALNLPMAIYTVFLGLKERFERHKKIAPYTAAVWIYVAATGWAIYFFLH